MQSFEQPSVRRERTIEPEVWIVAGVLGTVDSPLIDEVKNRCDVRGLPHTLVRVDGQKDSAGKPRFLLPPRVANRLYRRLHESRVGVLATVPIEVRLNPARRDLDERWTVSLRRLVRYKAFYAKISSRNIEEALDGFESWYSVRHVEDERDPRLLPLHTFTPKRDENALNTLDGRNRFERIYGPPLKRISDSLVWTPAPERHGGREPQNVAGLAIDPGMHWNVSTSQRRSLHTLVGVVEIPGRRYANVYPNGHVRAGKGTRRVKLG